MIKILLVDDDIELVNMIKEYLEQEGVDVLRKMTLDSPRKNLPANSKKSATPTASVRS